MDYSICPNCGRKFEKEKWNQKYCVSNCKNKYWNKKAKRIPVGLSEEDRKKVEAIIARKKLRQKDTDTDSDALDAL